MPNSQGVQSVTALMQIGGISVPVREAGVHIEATRQSSTFNATAALDSFGGDSFFAGLSSNEVTITVDDHTLFDGEIDPIDISYDEGVVRLTGRDHSAKLHEQKSSEKFTNQTRADIVKTIAQRNGLTANISGGMMLAGKLFQIDYVKLTDSISDAAILHKLAELEGASWWVKGKTLNFGQQSSGSYQVTLNRHPGGPVTGNFVTLNIYWNMQAAKSHKLNLSSWNTKQKKVISATASVNGISGQQIYNYRVAGLQQDQATDLAKKKLAEHIRHELTILAGMAGDVTLDPSMKLQLQGTAFDGSYTIDSIEHQIGWRHGHMMMVTARDAKSGRSVE
jgi:phage protein D